MTGTRCSQNSHPCLGLLVVSTASQTHIEALLTPLAHETRISDNVIAYVTAASRLSRVYKLFARSCLSLQTEQTYLKLRSSDHKCPDVETPLPNSLYIQEGRLGFGGMNSPPGHLKDVELG